MEPQHGWSAAHPLVGAQLRVLVVDSKAASRCCTVQLLRDCSYSVYAVRTTKEALQLLAPAATGAKEPPFDIIVKEHEPPEVSANRLLRRMARTELLAKIPVVLASSNDDRDVVMKCLTLGAIDYLIKPLRHNELRHIWTRVFIWRKSGLGNGNPHALAISDRMDFQESSEDGRDTKCDDDEQPTSKEGSAPDNGNGSNGNGSNGNGTSNHNHGSNGNGNGTSGIGASRVDAKQHAGDGSGNNDNSGSKNGHHNGQGSNGNGAATSLAEQNALLNTAEGKPPPVAEPGCKVAMGRSFRPYNQQGSRKRPAAAMQAAEPLYDCGMEAHHRHHQRQHLGVGGGGGGLADNDSNQGMVLEASARHQGDSWRTSAEDGSSCRQPGVRGREGERARAVAAVNGDKPGAAVPASDASTLSDVVLGSGGGTDAAAAGGAGAGAAAARPSAGAPRGDASAMHAASEDTIHPHSGIRSLQQAMAASDGAAACQVGRGTSALVEATWGCRTSAFSAPAPQQQRVSIGHAPGIAVSCIEHDVKPKLVSAPACIPKSETPGAEAPGEPCTTAGSEGGTGGAAAAAPPLSSATAPSGLGSQASLQVHMAAGSMLGGSAGGPGLGSGLAGPRLGLGLGLPGPMGLPSAWGQQALVLQATLAAGGGLGVPAFQPPMPMLSGGLFPGAVPYPAAAAALLGVPPHLLQQLHPQALQALLASSSLSTSLSQGSAGQGVDSAFSGVATSLYSPFPGLYLPQQAAAALLTAQQQQQQQQQQAAAAWQPPSAPMTLQPPVPTMPMFLGQGGPAWQSPEQQQQQQLLDGFRAATSLPLSTLQAACRGLRPAVPLQAPGPPPGAALPGPLRAVEAVAPPPPRTLPPTEPAAVAANDEPLVPPAMLAPGGRLVASERSACASEQRKQRAAALAKYRTKRQNLKFGNVIRYESRKHLAQQRPRVKGQFVKHALSGVEDGGDAGGGGGGQGEEDTQDEGGEVAVAAAGRLGRRTGGFGGQNFDQGGGYDRNPDGDATEEEEDGSGGGSGTDAGDGLLQRAGNSAQRPATAGDKTPESEEPAEEPAPEREAAAEEGAEEDDEEVVNSLRKLRGGRGGRAAAAATPTASASAAAAHAGGSGAAIAGYIAGGSGALRSAGGGAGVGPGSLEGVQGCASRARGSQPHHDPPGAARGQKAAAAASSGGPGAAPASAGGHKGGARPPSRLVVVGTRGPQQQAAAAAVPAGHVLDASHRPSSAALQAAAEAGMQRQQQQALGSEDAGLNKNGSDSGSNSPDDNNGGKGPGADMNRHGSAGAGSGHGGGGSGSHEASGHRGPDKGAGRVEAGGAGAAVAASSPGRRHIGSDR